MRFAESGSDEHGKTEKGDQVATEVVKEYTNIQKSIKENIALVVAATERFLTADVPRIMVEARRIWLAIDAMARVMAKT